MRLRDEGNGFKFDTIVIILERTLCRRGKTIKQHRGLSDNYFLPMWPPSQNHQVTKSDTGKNKSALAPYYHYERGRDLGEVKCPLGVGRLLKTP